MRKFKELLSAETDDLMADLRRAFRPLTPPIDISESISMAITVLVNLTDRVEEQRDLFDKNKCKEKLRNEKWWKACVKTVCYRQSHNVKFPDIRAVGTIRAKPIGELPEYLFSSSNIDVDNLCYSRDSAGVNKAAFLTSEFIWHSERTCLGLLLADIGHPLWDTLKKLGCYQKTRKVISKQLAEIPEYVIDIKLAPNYLSQITFPDGKGSYISLSPVASQSIQSHCYQALEDHYRRTALTRYSRATNMGALATSCGGAFRMLRSLPFVHRHKHQQLDTRIHWLTRASVKAMNQYLASDKWLLPSNKLKLKRQEIRKQIEDMIVRWLDNQDVELSAQHLTEYFNDDLSRTNLGSRLAYNVRLTNLIYRIISKLKNADKVETVVVKEQESDGTRYLLLPSLKVVGASAMHGPFSVGLPSMMAIYGFVHAFERRAKVDNFGFSVDSFAVCVHKAHIEKRGLTREYVEKVLKDDNGMTVISPPATRDDWQCDLQLSLILKCNGQLESEDVVRILPKRLARGNCLISISDIKRFKSFQKLKDAVISTPESSGRWLTLNHDICINRVEDMMSALTDSNLSLCCVGYHFLESPNEKPFSLRGYPHAFCEVIMALIKPLTIKHERDLEQIFWRYQADKSYACINQ
ncbi:type I-F CRISPR-associated protein Csy2 [Photobacterium swingsii]|uniref:type I-F CRISPR-associated protein Csy2 n=1 Tax=Photobacterium swingsii TaxID=680026 RepID=UPI004069447F